MSNKENVVFERHGTNAQIGDGIKVKVPANVSVLSLAGTNTFFDGDDFCCDPHWIHNRNLASRKKMTEIDGCCVWTRKCEDDYISTIEQKLFEFEEKVYSLVVPLKIDLMKKILDAGRTAHAIPKNSGLNENMIWLFNVRWDIEYQCNTYSWNWVDRPTEFTNLELGQQLYHADRRSKVLSARLWKFRVLFKYHIDKAIDKVTSNLKRIDQPGVVILTINGREYVASSQREDWKVVQSMRIEL